MGTKRLSRSTRIGLLDRKRNRHVQRLQLRGQPPSGGVWWSWRWLLQVGDVDRPGLQQPLDEGLDGGEVTLVSGGTSGSRK